MKKRLSLLLLIAATLATGSAAQELTLGETIDAQRALIETRPDDANLHNDLGNLLLLVGDRQGAEASYRQALSIDSELVAAHFNLGLIFQQTRRNGKARREFKRTAALEPEHAWAHYQLGVLSALEGKRNAAIRSYARALRLEPRLTDPAFNPHILDNHLAPDATLEAYADISSADLVPRTYESPRRIAGLLVSLTAEAVEEAVDELEQPVSAIEDDAVTSGSDADGFEDEPAMDTQATTPVLNRVKPVPQQPVKKKKPRRKRTPKRRQTG